MRPCCSAIRSAALFDQREHAERQEVDLDEARVVEGVLVPLADVAALHGRALDRHQLDDRLRGDHHAADVLAEVAREAGDLLGQLDEVAPDRRIDLAGVLGIHRHLVLDVAAAAPSCPLRQPVELALGEAQRLADVADGAAQLVGGEAGDERGVLVAEVLVDAQDQLLADVAREVEVDVGHGARSRRSGSGRGRGCA